MIALFTLAVILYGCTVKMEAEVKVWVAKRRQSGVLLEQPKSLWDAAEPCELLVLNVTDQGQRKPGKVARLYPTGAQRMVAELLAPKLVWFKSWQLVISGVEAVASDKGRKGVAQTWICRLAVPYGVTRFRAVHMFDYGVELERRMLADRFARSTSGRLVVDSIPSPIFGRSTTRAAIGEGDCAADSMRSPLLECGLDWVSSDRFALSGFEPKQKSTESPLELLQQGWICRFDLEQALEHDEARAGREAFPQHG